MDTAGGREERDIHVFVVGISARVRSVVVTNVL